MEIIHADCVEAMAAMEPNSVDAIVTDPPYGLKFMGKGWDHGVPVDWIEPALRVLKPGGHLLAFGGTRTYHRLTCAIEDAGFEIRDCLCWLYGSGFPKSRNIGDGWGTALKPAHEPIVLARKPISEKNIAANVLKWGTGAINVDGCRIGTEGEQPSGGTDARNATWKESGMTAEGASTRSTTPPAGRWPANLILDPEAARLLDEQSGESVSTGGQASLGAFRDGAIYGKGRNEVESRDPGLGDRGGASRFFYVAKPSTAEREGEDLPLLGVKKAPIVHPTMKPVELMRYLVRLVTPKGGVVLDPFMGSGTTGMAAGREGFDFIGIEREAEYVAVARARLGD